MAQITQDRKDVMRNGVCGRRKLYIELAAKCIAENQMGMAVASRSSIGLQIRHRCMGTCARVEGTESIGELEHTRLNDRGCSAWYVSIDCQGIYITVCNADNKHIYIGWV